VYIIPYWLFFMKVDTTAYYDIYKKSIKKYKTCFILFDRSKNEQKYNI